MIQRIQSIFLFLAGIAFGGFFLFPFATTEKTYSDILADAIYNINDSMILLILAALGVLVTIGNIFLFKNRPLQIKLTYLSLFFGMVIPIVAAIVFMNASGSEAYEQDTVNAGIAIFLPLIIIILSILAARGIKKDQKIVKSMDRLR